MLVKSHNLPQSWKKNYPKEIFIFSPQGIYFFPQFLSLVNDHTEPMTTFTAWIKKKNSHCIAKVLSWMNFCWSANVFGFKIYMQ